MYMFDVIITGGRVLDGSGNPWFWADLGIKDGRIAALVRTAPGGPSPLLGQAAVHIDATGKVVSPGFIDTHSHSDLPLLINPTADSKVRQGITTEVIGQCGSTAAPLTEASLAAFKGQLKDLDGEGIEVTWRSYGEYLDTLAARGTAVNVAGLVGHGPVRVAAMGFANRAPSAAELQTMGDLIRHSIEEGAIGWSTGLIYTPGSYSELPELISLGKAAASAGGMYFTHMRSEGEGIFEAVAEALAIGRASGTPVHIAHLKAAGWANGKADQLIATLEAARAQGVDVTADQYPYIAGSTGLAALLPPWAHEGGRDKMIERLRDATTRAKMEADMKQRLPGWDNDFRCVPWTNVVISRCDDKSLEGRSIEDIATSLSKDPYQTVFDILAHADPATGMIVFMMREDEVRMMMAHDIVMVGTDGSCLRPTGTLGQGKPHPRNYGTFPRILGKYVREEKALTLQQAVRKMTSAAANRLGLSDRGQLRQGWCADVVVFDPATVIDRATFADPHQFPAGIEYVLVNGQVVVSAGQHTGALPGVVLRSKH